MSCVVQERTEFDEPDYALIDTLFSLAEAHLFMQIIELMESQPGIMPPKKTFADIYRCIPIPFTLSIPRTFPVMIFPLCGVLASGNDLSDGQRSCWGCAGMSGRQWTCVTGTAASNAVSPRTRENTSTR